MLRFYISLLSNQSPLSVQVWSHGQHQEQMRGRRHDLDRYAWKSRWTKWQKQQTFPGERAFPGNSFSIFLWILWMHHLFKNTSNYTFIKCQHTQAKVDIQCGRSVFRKWSGFSLPWARSSANEGAARACTSPQVLITVQCLPEMSQSPHEAFLFHSCVWDERLCALLACLTPLHGGWRRSLPHKLFQEKGTM